MIPQLTAALDDLEANGTGHASFTFLTNFPFTKEHKVEVIQKIFAIDIEFVSLEPLVFMGIESKDVRKGIWPKGNWPTWLECFSFIQNWAAIVPFNKRANMFVLQIIITNVVGATYVIEPFTIAQYETHKMIFYPEISKSCKDYNLNELAQRSCSPVWKRFLKFLTMMHHLFIGWGTAQDQIIMQNHFGYKFIGDAKQRQFLSRTDPNCEQLDHQMQLIDMQKVVELTWIPSMAGCDARDQDQQGFPLLIQLANVAMTLLTMAAMPKFASTALQETIYMHKRSGGYTEPKLFLYHEQVREDTSK